jgi:RimJ/RimL family protein N-acetyltransferase
LFKAAKSPCVRAFHDARIGVMSCLGSSLLAAAQAPGLEITKLQPSDAEEYYYLVQQNKDHLARDYSAQVAASLRDTAERFDGLSGINLRFGIRLHQTLIGRVDLDPVDPPRYSIGYWLDLSSCGRGLATSACAQAILFAVNSLAATDIYAGVTHGNLRSVALLDRLGFTAVADFESYSRFHLPLDGGAPRNPPT